MKRFTILLGTLIFLSIDIPSYTQTITLDSVIEQLTSNQKERVGLREAFQVAQKYSPRFDRFFHEFNYIVIVSFSENNWYHIIFSDSKPEIQTELSPGSYTDYHVKWSDRNYSLKFSIVTSKKKKVREFEVYFFDEPGTITFSNANWVKILNRH